MVITVKMYNRARAVAYARRWALSRNPEYFDFSMLGGDCTNFASQCIYQGAEVMNYTQIFGWYYINANNRTPSWTGVNELYSFLTTNTGAGPVGREVCLSEIEAGDIIQLRFAGERRFSHTPVVVDAGDKTPSTVLIAAHSRDSLNRPLSTYMYTELRPVHIIGVNG